jgi:hypothetical protein
MGTHLLLFIISIQCLKRRPDLGSEKANGVKEILQVGLWSCLLLIIVLLISSREPSTGHTFSYSYRSVREDESVKCELWGSGLGARRRTAGVQWTLGLRISTRVFLVFIVPPTEPVRFGSGFASFRFLKPKPNRIEFFFKNFSRFNRFFWLFFSWFNRFLGFFAHP